MNVQAHAIVHSAGLRAGSVRGHRGGRDFVVLGLFIERPVRVLGGGTTMQNGEKGWEGGWYGDGRRGVRAMDRNLWAEAS